MLGQSVPDPLLAHLLRRRLADRVPHALRQALTDALGRARDHALRRGSGHSRHAAGQRSARRARATSGASTRCASGRSARSPCRRSTGSTAPPSSRRSRSRVTARAATCAPQGRGAVPGAAGARVQGMHAPQPPHGPPLAFASCNPPELRSDYLTMGSPDANGAVANSVGSVRFAVFANGNPSTPADEADVNVVVQPHRRAQAAPTCPTTPASCRPTSVVRVTDTRQRRAPGRRLRSRDGERPLVPDDRPVHARDRRAPRWAATCASTTTFDAVLPGAIKEGDRSIWQLGAGAGLRRRRGRPVLATSPNTLFARQGVFVP